MKPTLQQRLVQYFEKNPNRQLAKGDICRRAEDAMGVTGESVGRRLRVLHEVSEWPSTISDTPEHTKARELLGGAKIRRELKDGHCFYTYEPPASKRVRRVKIVDGKAVEYWEEISSEETK